MNNAIRRGQIYFADIPKTEGSVYYGIRPVLIVSNDTNNRHSCAITACPITSNTKRLNFPTHVSLKHSVSNGLNLDSVVMCENISNYSTNILLSCIGEVSQEVMRSVEKAIMIQLGII